MSLTPDISIQLTENRQKTLLQDPDLVALIDACQANDRSAQATLYKRYYGKMMALCMRYVKNRDDAMSVLNYGFLKVYKSLSTYEYNGSFDGWVYKIVYNSILDQLRSNMRDMKTSELSEATETLSYDSSGLQNLMVEDLYKLLDALPDSTRIVFNLFAIEGYKHEEIADLLKISAGTSKWHVNQARTILKSLLLNHHKAS
jgi:RNA polymerase sigma-70 factor (ECF subfamily)